MVYPNVITVDTIAHMISSVDYNVNPVVYISTQPNSGPFVWKSVHFYNILASKDGFARYVLSNYDTGNTGAWVRDIAWASVRDWGAYGDGSTSDTSAIQRAIDFLSGYNGSGLTGGTLYFPEGTYPCHLTQRSGVELIGSVTHGFGTNSPVIRARLIPDVANGTIIDSPAAVSGTKYTLTGAAIRGFLFDGQASAGTPTAGANVGITIHSGLKVTIDQCAFKAFNRSAIVMDRAALSMVANGPLYITDCYASSCMLNPDAAQAQMIGIFDLRGDNGIIRGCEVSGNNAKSSSKFGYTGSYDGGAKILDAA